MRLKDRVAIITGAASGIGKAIAVAFAKEGANVVIANRNAAAGEKTAAEINQLGYGKAIHVTMDISKVEDWDKTVKKTAEVFGGIDISTNNAGVVSPNMVDTVDEISLEHFDYVINVDLKGTFLGMRAVVPYLAKNKLFYEKNLCAIFAKRWQHFTRHCLRELWKAIFSLQRQIPSAIYLKLLLRNH